MRAVLEMAGVKDVLTKTIGSNNKINVVKATVEALKQLRTVEQEARRRDLTPIELRRRMSRRPQAVGPAETPSAAATLPASASPVAQGEGDGTA